MGRILRGLMWPTVLAVMSFLAWGTLAHAEDIMVTSPNDDGKGTLREALREGQGDVIRFNAANFPPGSPVVISLQSKLPELQQNTRLVGTGAGVIIDGSGVQGTVDGLVVAGASVEISDLTVRGFPGNGIVIESGAHSGNISGTQVLSNRRHGILVRGSDNRLEGNVVSGNDGSGVRLEGSTASGNLLDSNIIGLSPDAATGMGNHVHGIEITRFAHDNLIGQTGRGNIVASNLVSGIVLSNASHHNQVVHNRIGMNDDKLAFPGGHPSGGILIVDGSHHNTIGGPTQHYRNWVGGAGKAGVIVGSSVADASSDNAILGNAIGWLYDPAVLVLTPAAARTAGLALPNNGHGVLIDQGAFQTRIEANNISANQEYGVEIVPCARTTVARNSISRNARAGIHYENECVDRPSFARTLSSYFPYLRFKAKPGAQVEFFYDDADDGMLYVGSSRANIQGYADYLFPKERPAANITATSTDVNGNTSEFSAIYNSQWTVLLYLSGDNDLQDFVGAVLTDLANGERRQANVLALVDTQVDETALYDLSGGRLEKLDSYWGGGELNMGDGKTLRDFINYGFGSRATPHQALIILDHGGGWAPPNPITVNVGPALPRHHIYLGGGGSGLSWDDSAASDYLDSVEMRDALRGTGRRMDVLFYDVCVMGMAEVAYQVRSSTDFFVSSQNLGWAPEGDPTRYWAAIETITATTSPREFAEALVRVYGTTLTSDGHPHTIAAVDTKWLPQLARAVTALGVALRLELPNPGVALRLREVYLKTQKVDYNTDLKIEQDTEGYVDLFDLAYKLTTETGQSPRVVAAAQAVLAMKDAIVLAEDHQSGTIYRTDAHPQAFWNFDGLDTLADDGLTGLSLYLPLGEDAMYHFDPQDSGSLPISDIPLRDTYTCTALDWVCETDWDMLIRRYYEIARSPNSPVPPILPRLLDRLRGLLPPAEFPDEGGTSTESTSLMDRRSS